jgi:hypothetical protein
MTIRFVHHTDPEHIPLEESAVFGAAAWASNCERRLLGLHCGQHLDWDRHVEWARQKFAVATTRKVPGTFHTYEVSA